MAHEYGKETLSKEFKSDLKGLPDSELVEAVVALANTDGGCVYLGVEDDGTRPVSNKSTKTLLAWPR